jgi:hypothetical protein
VTTVLTTTALSPAGSITAAASWSGAASRTALRSSTGLPATHTLIGPGLPTRTTTGRRRSLRT